MYIEHLLKDELLGFLKDEYKYSEIDVIKFERDNNKGYARLDIKLVNIKKDVFKLKIMFYDFKCEVQDLFSNKVIAKHDKAWVNWVTGVLKVRENMGDNKLPSARYQESYNIYKSIKTKKTKKTKVREDELKIG